MSELTTETFMNMESRNVKGKKKTSVSRLLTLFAECMVSSIKEFYSITLFFDLL